MSSNAFRTDLALLLFNNTAIANIGNVAGLQPSGVAGSLFVALHTADPTLAGAQNASEATFGAYARQAVARSSAGWTVSGNNASNTDIISFPEATSGSETITHFSVGYEVSGATKIIASAALDNSRAVSTGITLSFAIGDLDVNVT